MNNIIINDLNTLKTLFLNGLDNQFNNVKLLRENIEQIKIENDTFKNNGANNNVYCYLSKRLKNDSNLNSSTILDNHYEKNNQTVNILHDTLKKLHNSFEVGTFIQTIENLIKHVENNNTSATNTQTASNIQSTNIEQPTTIQQPTTIEQPTTIQQPTIINNNQVNDINKIYDGYLPNGNDINRLKVGNIDRCKTLCDRTANCKSWTYNKNNICHLKNAYNSTNVVPHADWKSGFKSVEGFSINTDINSYNNIWLILIIGIIICYIMKKK